MPYNRPDSGAILLAAMLTYFVMIVIIYVLVGSLNEDIATFSQRFHFK